MGAKSHYTDVMNPKWTLFAGEFTATIWSIHLAMGLELAPVYWFCTNLGSRFKPGVPLDFSFLLTYSLFLCAIPAVLVQAATFLWPYKPKATRKSFAGASIIITLLSSVIPKIIRFLVDQKWGWLPPIIGASISLSLARVQWHAGPKSTGSLSAPVA